jgi:hypothetical protein
MKLSRKLRWWAISAIAIAGTVILLGQIADYFYSRHRVDADAVEHSLRSELPIGSPLPVVEEALRSRKMEFSFEVSSHSVYAVLRDVKGSSFLIDKSVLYTFHFDEGLTLRSIDVKTELTGP